MNTYILSVKHDEGVIKLQVKTNSYAKAVELTMEAEGCPERAIINIQKI